MVADKDKHKKKPGPSMDSEYEDSEHTEDSSEPIVRDKRKIDPETGEPRVASDPAAEPVDSDSDDVDNEMTNDEMSDGDEKISDEDLVKFLEQAAAPADAVSEHLNDLKRVQAEYANYRKRVDRDRYVARELAVAEVMTGILPVLDDLDLAQQHGDLEGGPLQLVAQKIRTSFERYGLVQVGAVGDVFDPKLHEAIAQLPSKDVTVETIADVVLPGYQLGDRLLRAAKVAVSVPEG